MQKPKISYICDKTLFLSSICDKYQSKDAEIFEILEIPGLTIDM